MRSLCVVTIVLCLLLPAAAFGGITCQLVIGAAPIIQIFESPVEGQGSGTCPMPPGVAPPPADFFVDLFENQFSVTGAPNPEFNPNAPVSDYLDILANGLIVLTSDPNGIGLVPRTQAQLQLQEPPEGSFDPVTFQGPNAIYQVFSDVQDVPEPGTLALLLAGTALVLIKRR